MADCESLTAREEQRAPGAGHPIVCVLNLAARSLWPPRKSAGIKKFFATLGDASQYAKNTYSSKSTCDRAGWDLSCVYRWFARRIRVADRHDGSWVRLLRRLVMPNHRDRHGMEASQVSLYIPLESDWERGGGAELIAKLVFSILSWLGLGTLGDERRRQVGHTRGHTVLRPESEARRMLAVGR